MPSSYVRVAIHFVWATWDRENTILPDWEESLYAFIAGKCKEIDCELYAVNGTTNHVHVFLRLTANLSIADVAKLLKGSSSFFINTTFAPIRRFQWQGSYGAFAVDRENVDQVRTYILNQKQHHSDNTAIPEYEQSHAEVTLGKSLG